MFTGYNLNSTSPSDTDTTGLGDINSGFGCSFIQAASHLNGNLY